jgi:hypothetical protein
MVAHDRETASRCPSGMSLGLSIVTDEIAQRSPVLRQNWRSAVAGHDRECLRRQSPYDRDGLRALTFRDGVRTVTRVLPSTCGAVDELTSGGASFVAVVQAADFRECHDVTLGDVLHASGRWRVFRQREMGP